MPTQNKITPDEFLRIISEVNVARGKNEHKILLILYPELMIENLFDEKLKEEGNDRNRRT